jgi:hypothetical protein
MAAFMEQTPFQNLERLAPFEKLSEQDDDGEQKKKMNQSTQGIRQDNPG